MHDRHGDENDTAKSMSEYWDSENVDDTINDSFDQNICNTCNKKYKEISLAMKDYIRISQILFYSLFRKTYAFAETNGDSGLHDPDGPAGPNFYKMSPDLFKELFYSKKHKSKSRIFMIIQKMQKSYSKIQSGAITVHQHREQLDKELKVQIKKIKREMKNEKNDFEKFIQIFDMDSAKEEEIKHKFLEPFAGSSDDKIFIEIVNKAGIHLLIILILIRVIYCVFL